MSDREPSDDELVDAWRAEAENPTDLGNARRLVRLHGADLRFVPAWSKWIVWDDRRWRTDEDGEVVRRAKRTVASIYKEAASAAASREPDLAKTLATWAGKSEAEARISAMVSLAATEPGVPIALTALDTDPWLFNVENGTLDLRTGKLRSQRRDDFITRLSPVTYDPDAQSPVWNAFLERVQQNPEVRAFLKRAAGYTLTGTTREEVLFFVHGDGSNGKTRFLEALATGLGPDYARTADFSLFTAQRHDGPRNDIARLAGVRYVKSSEMDDGRRLAEALIKTLTGGDRISARFLFREAFEFEPSFKPWLAANYRPEIRGADHGIWRRIMLIPFTERIEESERDKELSAKLRVAAPAVLRWAVDGCLEWQRVGLKPPAAVLAATEAYREESDQVARFIGECCELVADATAHAAALYEAYRRQVGSNALSATAFGRELTRRGYGTIKSGTVKRTGLRLRSTAFADSSDSLDSSGEASI